MTIRIMIADTPESREALYKSSKPRKPKKGSKHASGTAKKPKKG